MARRKTDAPTRISIMIPADLLAEVDGWKTEIENISRSELLSKLARFALDHDAIDHLYPDHTGEGLPQKLADTRTAQIPAPVVDTDSRMVRSPPRSPRPSIEQGPIPAQRSELAHSTTPAVNQQGPEVDTSLAGPPPAISSRPSPFTPSTPIPKEPEPGSKPSALVKTHTGGTTTGTRTAPRPGPEGSSAWSVPKANSPERAPLSDPRTIMTPEEFKQRISKLQRRVEQI